MHSAWLLKSLIPSFLPLIFFFCLLIFLLFLTFSESHPKVATYMGCVATAARAISEGANARLLCYRTYASKPGKNQNFTWLTRYLYCVMSCCVGSIGQSR